MKLWEILNVENRVKKYEDSTGRYYKLDLDHYGRPSLFDYDGIVSFSQADLMQLDFEEIGIWTGWERVAKDELYYYIDSESKVASKVECEEVLDSKLYEVCNYFSDEKVAEKVSRDTQMFRDMLKFYTINDDQLDWENDYYKYCISIPANYSQFYTIDRVHQNQVVGVVYFSNIRWAKECITEVLKKYYGTSRCYIAYTWKRGSCDSI